MLGGFDDSLAVKTKKNDAADAEAICEAVGRPNMRFVPIKSIAQQAILSIHRVRQGFVKARTAQANQIRGLLGEFGLVIPRGIWNVARRVHGVVQFQAEGLRGVQLPCNAHQRLGELAAPANATGWFKRNMRACYPSILRPAAY